MSKWLTRKEAAHQMGISEITMDRLRKAGKLAYVQHVPGGKVWVSEDAIAECIARGTHAAKHQREVTWTYRKRRK